MNLVFLPSIAEKVVALAQAQHVGLCAKHDLGSAVSLQLVRNWPLQLVKYWYLPKAYSAERQEVACPLQTKGYLDKPLCYTELGGSATPRQTSPVSSPHEMTHHLSTCLSVCLQGHTLWTVSLSQRMMTT